jgi:hypothetical protein
MTSGDVMDSSTQVPIVMCVQAPVAMSCRVRY